MIAALILAACGDPAPPARPLTTAGPTGDPRIAMTQAMDLVLQRPSVQDLWPDRPYRVDLRDAPAGGRPALGLLDLDRDGRFDQRWTRTPGGDLLVASSEADDGRYGPAALWTGPVMPGALTLPGSAAGGAQ